MDNQVTANGTKEHQTNYTKGEEDQIDYMQFFRELSLGEAKLLKKRIRIDAELHAYIMRVLYSVREGKEILIPPDFPVAQKPLKATIKKISRTEGIDIPVRFDSAIDGGFVVRQATIDEQVLGDWTGERLGGARRKK